MDSLEKEKCALLTSCKSLRKDLEKVRRESEKPRVSAEDRGVQTDLPIFSHEESTVALARASTSERETTFGTPPHQTQDGAGIGEDGNNPQTYK